MDTVSDAENHCCECGRSTPLTCDECHRAVCEIDGNTRRRFATGLYGPALFKSGRLFQSGEHLCGGCRSRRVWLAWRAFVVLVGGAVSVAGIANGHYLAPVVAAPVVAIWWWLSGNYLTEEDRPRPPS